MKQPKFKKGDKVSTSLYLADCIVVEPTIYEDGEICYKLFSLGTGLIYYTEESLFRGWWKSDAICSTQYVPDPIPEWLLEVLRYHKAIPDDWIEPFPPEPLSFAKKIKLIDISAYEAEIRHNYRYFRG